MLGFIASVGKFFGNMSQLGYIMLSVDASVQTDFIGDLYRLSPIIGLLLIAIGYLAWTLHKNQKAYKKTIKDKDAIIKAKDEELKELNKDVRQSEKDNLITLQKVSSTLDRVIDSQKSGDNIVLKEIDNLKDIILLKLKKDD